ncbi:MAG: hypothetical protein AB7N91_01345 [Candidatus Tectimicrobiota bacterium]
MPMTRAYEEIIDWIAAGVRPEDVVAFRPSPEAKARVADLLCREKTSGLSVEETAELHHFLQLEHLMRLARARARAHLTHE